jgi:hypothetical protein
MAVRRRHGEPCRDRSGALIKAHEAVAAAGDADALAAAVRRVTQIEDESCTDAARRGEVCERCAGLVLAGFAWRVANEGRLSLDVRHALAMRHAVASPTGAEYQGN